MAKTKTKTKRAPQDSFRPWVNAKLRHPYTGAKKHVTMRQQQWLVKVLSGTPMIQAYVETYQTKSSNQFKLEKRVSALLAKPQVRGALKRGYMLRGDTVSVGHLLVWAALPLVEKALDPEATEIELLQGAMAKQIIGAIQAGYGMQRAGGVGRLKSRILHSAEEIEASKGANSDNVGDNGLNRQAPASLALPVLKTRPRALSPQLHEIDMPRSIADLELDSPNGSSSSSSSDPLPSGSNPVL